MREAAARPLTEAQAAIWYAQNLDPANPVYNCAHYVEITGELDVVELARAVRNTVAETDALNLVFGAGPDGPWQRPVPFVAWPMPAHDLRNRPDPVAAAVADMRADLARPVPLDAGEPLFGSAVYRVGDDRYLWYLRIHHLCADGYAFTAVAGRVAERYTAAVEGREPRAGFGRLADLLDEEEAYRASERYAADRSFWLERFADRPDVPGLSDAAAPPAYTFTRVEGRMPAKETARLRDLADAAKVAWPELVLAAVAVYTHKMTGSGDVVLGMPSMGRLGSVAARVPATVVNVLPLRLALAPETTVAEAAAAVRTELAEVRPHQRYRYEELRRDLRLLGSGRRLFGPQVNIKGYDHAPSFAGARGVVHYLAAGPVEDIEVIAYLDGDELRVDVDANPAVYGEEETAAHHRRLLALLTTLSEAGAGAAIGDLEVATPEERHQVLTAWNATAHDVPPACLPDLLDAQAARTPEATALVADGAAWTYAELDAAANRLARHLIGLGAGPGVRVAVAAPRSPELVTALLAVEKTGAAYVPIDPEYPDARIAFMLADAASVCVVTAGDTLIDGDGPLCVDLGDPDTAAAIAARPDRPVTDADRIRPLTPDDPAYVIYTSGSTGIPKGTVVGHRAIVNRLAWMQAEYGLTADDRVLQKTSASFDVSVWEFFWPLITGAGLVLARPGGHRDPAYLAGLIRAERVTTAHFVPSMLEVFLAEPAARNATPLRRVVCSGEALPARAVRRFGEVLPGVPLFNLYGPTEAAIDVTSWPCTDADTDPVPIGRPVWNTRIYVLDAGQAPVPPGVAGELYIGGVQLAHGYLNRPELTAERFVPDPYGPPGARMYRTGDRARWRPDGAVEFLGRADQQLKIRGFRVEPGEVEAALTALPEVAQAAVIGRGQRLAGYVVPAPGAHPDAAGLRDALAATLPAHLVPTDLVILDRLPLTANGKLDRTALPEPAATTLTEGRAPRTPREEVLCGLFAEALGLRRVGADDGFFDLGGHSLLAATLVTRVREVLGVECDLGAVFAAPTPAALARALDADGDVSALDTLLPLRTGGGRPGLFCFHPAGGLGWCYTGLLRHLPADLPVYAVQARGLRAAEPLPGSIDEMAADYVRAIRAAQPDGPYHLLGWSVGGVIAHAVATRLRDQGAAVGQLALLDAYPGDQWRDLAAPDERAALRALLYMTGHDEDVLDGAPLERDAVLTALRERGSAVATLDRRVLSAVVDVVVNNARLMREHRHARYDGDAVFFAAAAPRAETWLTRTAWEPYIAGGLTGHDIACTHPEMMSPGPLAGIGAVLAARLA